MNSLVGSSVSSLNWRNVSNPSSGYCKSGKKIVTFSTNARGPVCCSVAPHNLKPADEFSSSKIQDSSVNLFTEGSEETDVLIECKDVYKSFGEKHILRGVNFKIKHGEAVGIIGPSGTGKSTILKIIAGLLTPDKGEVYIRGRKRHGLISDDDMHGLRIGLVFQSAALFDSLTVRENVGFLMYEHSRMPEDKIKELVAETLAAVGLKVS
ncbi:putative ABC-type sulfate transporter [Helianthus anomalus]